jgi:hypothetical protein
VAGDAVLALQGVVAAPGLVRGRAFVLSGEEAVIFTKRLRGGVRSGQITCSVRIWTRPHVTVGKRYAMEDGQIEVDQVLPITLADVTPGLARDSGFKGVVDLLKVAKHGRGENVYLVRFHFIPPSRRVGGRRASARRNA